MMKPIAKSILLVVMTLILLTGCGNNKKEVVVLMYDLSDPFIHAIKEEIEDEMTSTLGADYNISIYDCERSQIRQNELAEQFYDAGVDLMVINPVERLSSYIFIERSKKEDIPLIFFNREPLEEDLQIYDQAYYVGANAIESGVMQANLVAEGFGGNPNALNVLDKNDDDIIQCVIVKGEQGHQDAEQRTSVVIKALEIEGYQVDVLATEIADWNEEEAYRLTKTIMENYGDAIELVISNNDAMAIGVTKYLQENSYYSYDVEGRLTQSPFMIVGIDGLSEAVDLVNDGFIYGTIINDGASMARAIVELSDFVLNGDTISDEFQLENDKYIWIPYKNFKSE